MPFNIYDVSNQAPYGVGSINQPAYSPFGNMYSVNQGFYDESKRIINSEIPSWLRGAYQPEKVTGGIPAFSSRRTPVVSSQISSPVKTTSQGKEIEVIDSKGRIHTVNAISGIKRELDGTVRLDQQTGVIRRLLEKQISEGWKSDVAMREADLERALQPAKEQVTIDTMKTALESRAKSERAEERSERKIKAEEARVAKSQATEKRMREKMENEVNVFTAKEAVKRITQNERIQATHENRKEIESEKRDATREQELTKHSNKIEQLKVKYGLDEKQATNRYELQLKLEKAKAIEKRDAAREQELTANINDVYKIKQEIVKNEINVIDKGINNYEKDYSIDLATKDNAIRALRRQRQQKEEELKLIMENRIEKLSQPQQVYQGNTIIATHPSSRRRAEFDAITKRFIRWID